MNSIRAKLHLTVTVTEHNVGRLRLRVYQNVFTISDVIASGQDHGAGLLKEHRTWKYDSIDNSKRTSRRFNPEWRKRERVPIGHAGCEELQ